MLALALTLACVPAQEQAPPVVAGGDHGTQLRRLSAPEPEQREDARRRLWRLPIDTATAEVLLGKVTANDAGATDAAALLAFAPGTHAALRARIDLAIAAPSLIHAALPALTVPDLWSVARRPPAPVAEAAVVELAARGRLTDPDVVGLLASDAPAVAVAMAASILAEEHAQLPADLWRDLVAAPDAAERLLRALADRPRLDHVPHLERLLEAEATPPGVRLLALAALPRARQTFAHARLVLSVLDREAIGHLPDFAASRLSSRVADGLVAGVHAAALDGKALTAMLPLLQNVSHVGEQHLVGLASAEVAADSEAICAWLEARRSPALGARVRAALDGEIPLDVWWLRRAGPHLQDPVRRARVLTELGAGGDRAAIAFEALLDAECFEPAMAAYALAHQDDRHRALRDVLRLPRRVLPVEFVRGLLTHEDPTIQMVAVNALPVDAIDEGTEAAVVACFRAATDDRVLGACARVLIAFGAQAEASAAFHRALGAGFGEAAVEWVTERPRAFSLALLRAEREVRTERRLLDDLDIGMARLGDRDRALDLLQRLTDLEPRLRKRAIAAVRGHVQDDAVALALRTLVETSDLDSTLREAMVDALLPRAAQEVTWLRARFEKEEDYDVRLAALRGLLATGVGEAMVRELTADFGRRSLREADEDLLQEVLGAAPLPLPAAVAEIGLRAVLVAPLGNPVSEAGHTLADTGTAAHYPFVLPLTDLIRRGPTAAQGDAVRSVVAEARDTRNAHALSRRRLGYLLSELALAAEPLTLGGDALARAIVAAPDRDETWLGPAHVLLGQRAEADGDLAAAAAAYRTAHLHCVRHPLPNVIRRRFVGDPDPARGVVPLAALAARADLLLARQARAAGDLATARAHLAAAAIAADGDDAATAEVAALQAEVGR